MCQTGARVRRNTNSFRRKILAWSRVLVFVLVLLYAPVYAWRIRSAIAVCADSTTKYEVLYMPGILVFLPCFPSDNVQHNLWCRSLINYLVFWYVVPGVPPNNDECIRRILLLWPEGDGLHAIQRHNSINHRWLLTMSWLQLTICFFRWFSLFAWVLVFFL